MDPGMERGMTTLTAPPQAPDALAVFDTDVLPPERLSASTLMAAEKCMLAGYLSRQTGNPSGEPAILGNHFHDVAAQVGFQAAMFGRTTFTPDEVERTALRVLQRPEESRPLSRHQMRELISLCRDWAMTAHFPIYADLYEVEMSVRNDLAGNTFSGRIDLLAIRGATAEIEDYKTGRVTPSQAEVEDEHPQLPTYAWHALQLYPWLELFILRERYIRRGVVREVILTRDDVLRHAVWLETTALRIRNAWAIRSFKPTPGKHCRYCPNAAACPLPEWTRPEAPVTREEAEKQYAAVLVEKARLKTRKTMLRAFLDAENAPSRVDVGGAEAFMEDTETTSFDRAAAEADGLDLEKYDVTTPSRRLKLKGAE